MMSRTTVRTARTLAGLACAGAFLSLGAGLGPGSGWSRPESAAQSAEVRSVVIVRHAEKDPAGGEDPSLSPAGLARAQDLAHLLGASGVTHLFASEYRRTRETLAPLAERTGVSVAERPARESERLLEELRNLPAGSLAVVAGHSNTVPALVRGLAGQGPSSIADDEYDRLFVVTRAQGSEPTLLELRYGD